MVLDHVLVIRTRQRRTQHRTALKLLQISAAYHGFDLPYLFNLTTSFQFAQRGYFGPQDIEVMEFMTSALTDFVKYGYVSDDDDDDDDDLVS